MPPVSHPYAVGVGRCVCLRPVIVRSAALVLAVAPLWIIGYNLWVRPLSLNDRRGRLPMC